MEYSRKKRSGGTKFWQLFVIQVAYYQDILSKAHWAWWLHHALLIQINKWWFSLCNLLNMHDLFICRKYHRNWFDMFYLVPGDVTLFSVYYYTYLYLYIMCVRDGENIKKISLSGWQWMNAHKFPKIPCDIWHFH